MAQVSVTMDVAAPADQVWQVLREFHGVVRWLPGIDRLTLKGEGVGAVRTLMFKEGDRVVERLESRDDAARTLSYAVLESSLPLEGCVSQLTVRDKGPAKAQVEWTTTFGAKGAPEQEVAKALEKSHRLALVRLQRILPK